MTRTRTARRRRKTMSSCVVAALDRLGRRQGEGMALHEGLPLGLEEHSDDEDEDSEVEEEEGDEKLL